MSMDSYLIYGGLCTMYRDEIREGSSRGFPDLWNAQFYAYIDARIRNDKRRLMNEIKEWIEITDYNTKERLQFAYDLRTKADALVSWMEKDGLFAVAIPLKEHKLTAKTSREFKNGRLPIPTRICTKCGNPFKSKFYKTCSACRKSNNEFGNFAGGVKIGSLG